MFRRWLSISVRQRVFCVCEVNCWVHYRLEGVQELCELKQPLSAGGLPSTVASQAVQLLNVGGPQLVETSLAPQPVYWHWREGGTKRQLHTTIQGRRTQQAASSKRGVRRCVFSLLL